MNPANDLEQLAAQWYRGADEAGKYGMVGRTLVACADDLLATLRHIHARGVGSPQPAPTDAEIEAAAQSIAQDIRIFTERGVRITDRRIAENALAAARGASPQPPEEPTG